MRQFPTSRHTYGNRGQWDRVMSATTVPSFAALSELTSQVYLRIEVLTARAILENKDPNTPIIAFALFRQLTLLELLLTQIAKEHGSQTNSIQPCPSPSLSTDHVQDYWQFLENIRSKYQRHGYDSQRKCFSNRQADVQIKGPPCHHLAIHK